MLKIAMCDIVTMTNVGKLLWRCRERLWKELRCHKTDLLFDTQLSSTKFASWLLPTSLLREVMQSPLFICPSIGLFPLYLWKRLTVDLEHLLGVDHDDSSQGIEGQGHRSG